MEGSAVFKGTGTEHVNFEDLPIGWFKDLHDLGMGREGELYHRCIWEGKGEYPSEQINSLQKAGLIIVEDSARGPMLTRTFRGTLALKEFKLRKVR